MTDQDAFFRELSRYRPYLSPAQFERLLADAALEAPSAIRLNLLKTDQPKETLATLQQKYGWQVQALPFAEDAVQISAWSTSPSQTIEHKLGHFYIQDAASILPVSLFTPSIEPKLVLDMAASPGGKTTQLIDAGSDRDLVIANDSASSRIPALRTVLQTWGACNYAVTNFPGERWGEWFPETFDRILLDAPCSMQSLRASSSHPHRPVTDDERGRLASRQTALLFSAAQALKVGGELVYSTCTLSPEEDEAVVSALLDANPQAFTIDPAPARHYQAPGLTEFGDQSFHPDVINSLRIWPFTFQTNGFFAANLTKVHTLAPQPNQSKPPERKLDAVELSQPSQEILIDYFQANFGFHLEELLERKQLGLYWRGDKIWLLPKQLFAHFASLPVQLTGTQIGQFIRQNFEPHPDFFHSYGHVFEKGFWILRDDQVEAWMKGYDLRGVEISGCVSGAFLQIRDPEGKNLGAGKYSKERLRNLLANRHLIR